MKLDFKAIKNQGIIQKIGMSLLFCLFVFVFLFQLWSYDWSSIQHVRIENFNFLLAAIIFVGANWFFEWKKWIDGMKSIHNFSDEVLQKGFYAGMLSGFLTPSALGNFIGRMTAVNKELKPKVVANTLMGNGAQFLISLFFGTLSLFLLNDLPEFANFLWIKVVVALIVFLGLVIYFLIGHVAILKNFSSKYLPSFVSISLRLRARFLIWSAIRYLVFSFQFYLVLKAFQPELTFEVWFWVWQLYLWTTLSPSLFLGKLFIRETMAIFVLSYAGVDLPIALLSCLLIWLINNALPSFYAYFKWKAHVLVKA
jgi:hypothetical protein|tara:strand:+ start:15280 stop:16212 length:933 start_codon:yes stop_codon:yes gene_type:complete